MSPRGRPSRRALHQRLESEVAELRNRFGGLPLPAEAEGIWTDIWYYEAHNSTALEGNTLVRREVEALLQAGRAVGNKELKDYLEVKGYGDAARWVYDQALNQGDWSSTELVTVTEIRHIHELAMGPVWDVAPHPDAFSSERPGHWRRHDIHPFSGGMTPPDYPEVPALVHDWVEDARRVTRDDAPIAEAIARRHAAFERIHPFIDGNGRTGRLVTNLLLVRLGYPPAVIQKRERPLYLGALDQADRGDARPLGDLFARAVLDNLMRFILPAIAGPARLVSLEALTELGLSVPALRAAAERGRLRASKAPDGSWRSSRRWVEEYKASRHRGPSRR